MRFLPVLDVQAGIVVRAVAGRRTEYRPLVSRLTNLTDPVAVARAIWDQFGWHEFYVADLDSIAARGLATNASHYDRLRAAGFRLWLDAGIRLAADADRLADAGIEHVVVGLETIARPTEWQSIVKRLGSERAVFSLDLRGGLPIMSTDTWGTTDALTIADRIVTDGGRHIILLDLTRVGTGGGPGTESLCAELVRRHPEISVYVGGGIRGWDDIRRIEVTGAAGVLLASSVHDGVIRSELAFDPGY